MNVSEPTTVTIVNSSTSAQIIETIETSTVDHSSSSPPQQQSTTTTKALPLQQQNVEQPHVIKMYEEKKTILPNKL